MVTEIKRLEQPNAEPLNEVVAHRKDFEQPKLTALTPVEYLKIQMSTPIPSELLLGSLRDGRLRMLEPIKVKITLEGQHVIAEATELNEFGFGENLSEALRDLQRAITELYFKLEEAGERLGQELQQVRTTLHQKVQERKA